MPISLGSKYLEKCESKLKSRAPTFGSPTIPADSLSSEEDEEKSRRAA